MYSCILVPYDFSGGSKWIGVTSSAVSDKSDKSDKPDKYWMISKNSSEEQRRLASCATAMPLPRSPVFTTGIPH